MGPCYRTKTGTSGPRREGGEWGKQTHTYSRRLEAAIGGRATPYLRLLRGLSQWTRCDTRNATPLNHCGPKPSPCLHPSPHPRPDFRRRLARSKKRWIYKGPRTGLAFRGFFSFAIRGRIALELRLMPLPGSALSIRGLCAILGKSLRANCREVSDRSFLRRRMDRRCISPLPL